MSRLNIFSSLLLSLTVVVGVFTALSQFDFPIVLFVRSFHFPLVVQLGNVGNSLGNGLTILLIGGGLLAAGALWHRQTFRWAGIHGLVAYAIAGVTTQLLKHVIGRPRPRFTHQHPFDSGASLEGGLDAFPSGHASSAFALAAVLARYFPRGSWIWYGAALFVAISRVIRGSHFPTDVVAGSLLGFFVGYVVSRPSRRWHTALTQAPIRFLPALVIAFAFAPVMFQGQSGIGTEGAMVMMGLGGLAILLGVGVRLYLVTAKSNVSETALVGFAGANTLIILGLALNTESLLVITFAVLACGAWWLMRGHSEGGMESVEPVEKTLGSERDGGLRRDRNWLNGQNRTLLRELCGVIGLVITLLFMYELKGLVPLV